MVLMILLLIIYRTITQANPTFLYTPENYLKAQPG